MVKKETDITTKKLNKLLDSDYYSQVIDTWFVMLEKVGGNPNRIKKEAFLKEAGLKESSVQYRARTRGFSAKSIRP